MSIQLSHLVLRALQKGDHKAFEDVFVAYFPKVKYFIFQLVRSESEAEELAQDVFVRLWTNHSSVDPNRSFDAYLFTIAYNVAVNHLKHQAVKENYETTLPPSEFSETPEEILYAKEIDLLIEMAVNRMPEQRQRIFRMSRREGMNNEQIATELQITRKTVENQLSLALKELRKIVSLFLFFIG